jgi:hypothetical protein
MSKPDLRIIKRLFATPNPAERDSLGWSSRVLAQVSIPYREPTNCELWERRNGSASIEITPWIYRDKATGEIVKKFPYGSLPRLLMLYMSSEALRTQSQRVDLGDSVWSFLREVGYEKKEGSIYGRLNEQAARLFNCGIRFSYQDDKILSGKNASVAADFRLWLAKPTPEQPCLFKSYVLLSDQFYADLRAHGFPVDLDIVRGLHQSPMALDIYTWLTYRMRAVNETGRPLRLAWGSLRWQFGGEFSRLRKFRETFSETLTALQSYWPALDIEPWEGGLIFKPSTRPTDRQLPVDNRY